MNANQNKDARSFWDIAEDVALLPYNSLRSAFNALSKVDDAITTSGTALIKAPFNIVGDFISKPLTGILLIGIVAVTGLYFITKIKNK